MLGNAALSDMFTCIDIQMIEELLGLLLGTAAPVMTPNGVDFLFFPFCTNTAALHQVLMPNFAAHKAAAGSN